MDSRTVGCGGDGGLLPEGRKGECRGGASGKEGLQAIAPLVCGVAGREPKMFRNGQGSWKMFFQHPLEIPCRPEKIFLTIDENGSLKNIKSFVFFSLYT